MKQEQAMALLRKHLLSPQFLFGATLTIGFFATSYLKVMNIIHELSSPQIEYLVTNDQSFWLLIWFLELVAIIIFVLALLQEIELGRYVVMASAVACGIALPVMFITDLWWMFGFLTKGQNGAFSEVFSNYWRQERWLYLLYGALTGALGFCARFFNHKANDDLPKWIQNLFVIAPFAVTVLLLPQVINTLVFSYGIDKTFNRLTSGVGVSISYLAGMLALWVGIMEIYKGYKVAKGWLIQLARATAISTALAFSIPLLAIFFGYTKMSSRNGLQGWNAMKFISKMLVSHSLEFLPIIVVLGGALLLLWHFGALRFNEDKAETSGKFGSADWANQQDLEELGFYKESDEPIIGMDDAGRLIRLPLMNKLTISPPGGGKTTSSSIPVLLTHNGPVLVFDVKGELWATTARYRAEVLGREIITIDPYNVTSNSDFRKGKPVSLLATQRMNPFDFLPEKEEERDRVISSLAASFIVSDKPNATSTHFDENAKILIRGLIDYIAKTRAPDKRNLTELYQILSQPQDKVKAIFTEMMGLSGRAAAAAVQVSRVGNNEKGSIFSTAYRHVDWISGTNVQYTLSGSDFKLHDFLKGKMDIFVVLPEDQVKEQGRLIRMLMALLMNLIVQANPSELPKNKILFLLDELAQLGYCPDVEQCIEVLRARNVVVWSVFQSLSQIELFTKPDLFKGALLKQIFTTDDVETMQWVQSLGGKRTIVNKTISSNKGDSRRKMQAFGGTVHVGESSSVHEMGTDLIQLNEIRELPKDQQMVFLHGCKPIKCRKVRYFEHLYFKGKYDPNPVEMVRHV